MRAVREHIFYREVRSQLSTMPAGPCKSGANSRVCRLPCGRRPVRRLSLSARLLAVHHLGCGQADPVERHEGLRAQDLCAHS